MCWLSSGTRKNCPKPLKTRDGSCFGACSRTCADTTSSFWHASISLTSCSRGLRFASLASGQCRPQVSVISWTLVELIDSLWFTLKFMHVTDSSRSARVRGHRVHGVAGRLLLHRRMCVRSLSHGVPGSAWRFPVGSRPCS